MLKSWIDYEQDVKARDRRRDLRDAFVVFACLIVLASVFGCESSVSPELREASSIAATQAPACDIEAQGRVSAHRFSCPAYDGSGTCVCDAEETMTDWGEWAFRELLILP